jgi:ubiquinone/menaquinone biosynthesis C-methylase UbiE
MRSILLLPNDNQYTGTDISPGLLRNAVKHFNNAGFKNSYFYVTSAGELPFEDNLFDVVLCILSLNFFDDIKKVFKEIHRVAGKEDAIFICSVPVPERNRLSSKIRGTLYSEDELERICKEIGFHFEKIPGENGALLYFKAILL